MDDLKLMEVKNERINWFCYQKVETCQEKIISIELKDPEESLSLNSEEMLLKMKLSPDLNDPAVVEVVNPVLIGDGSVNYLRYAQEDSPPQQRRSFHVEDNRLSLNDKMKSVLQELLENEKVKLNRSLSMAEESDGDEESSRSRSECYDDDDEGDLDEDSGSNRKNTVFIVREKLINDFYDYESDRCQIYANPNAESIFLGPDDVRNNNGGSEEELEAAKLKDKIIKELNVNETVMEEREIEEGDDKATLDTNANVPLAQSVQTTGGAAAAGKKKKKRNRKK